MRKLINEPKDKKLLGIANGAQVQVQDQDQIT